MKVLHVLHTSHPNISGYSIRSQNIVEHQSKIGINPIVITSPRGPNDSNEAWYNGIHYYRTRTPDSFNIIMHVPLVKEVIETQALERSLSRILTSNSLDLIHVYSPVLYALPALRMSERFSIPMIYEIRAFFEDSAVDRGTCGEASIRYKSTRFLETYVVRKCEAVVAICSGICNEIVSRGINEQKIHLIPNGVDTAKFVPMGKDSNLLAKYSLSGYIVMGFIGSFFRFEGLDYLIKAMHKLLKYRRDIKLIIVGGGDEETNLKTLTEESGLRESIIFTGRVPHEEVLRYYSIMDILVYPRIRTRQTELVTPLKPLEAMAMGKAVICSDVGGLMELVCDGRTGILFRAENIKDLIEKSLFLIDNEDYRKKIGAAARHEVVEKRDWSKIVMGYRRIYEEVLIGTSALTT